VAETETVTLNLDGTFATGASRAATAGEKLVEALDRLNNTLEEGKKKTKEHGEEIKKVAEPAEIARHALEGLSAGLKGMAAAFVGGDAKGVIEGATEALAGLASTLDLVIPGLGQAAAAAVKVSGAFAGLLASGVETALEVTALNAQLEATFEALGKGPEAGKQTIEMLDDVARTLPQSREELGRWTREIEKMGVTDLGQVRHELLATASAQGVLGEQGVTAFTRISQKIHDAIEGHHKLKIASTELTGRRGIGVNIAGATAERMGLTLEKLETQLKAGTVDAAKFGNALEEALIAKGAKGLDAMWRSAAWSKIKEAGAELFAGVDTTPITDAMRDLLLLFDQTQPSGEAMKTTVTDAFNGIVRAIGAAIETGEDMVLDFEIWGLSMELNLLPVWHILQKIGGVLGTVGQAVGLLDKPGAVPEVKSVGQMQIDSVTALLPGFRIGESIGKGLIDGLQSMFPSVFGKGKELGAEGVRGAREGAGVKSPSKPAIEIGSYVAAGLGIGMTSSSLPARAGRQLSSNALGGLAGSALASPGAGGSAGGGITLHVGTIHITAPQGVTDVAGLSATGLAVALERFQLGSGR
jgi:hypothetical protein